MRTIADANLVDRMIFLMGKLFSKTLENHCSLERLWSQSLKLVGLDFVYLCRTNIEHVCDSARKFFLPLMGH
jgi:hypothetical protein